MDVDKYIRLCALFSKEFLSNYDADPLPLVGFKNWYVRRLYWI